MPISTFSPKLKQKPTKSYKRFVYPTPGSYTPRHTETENQVTNFCSDPIVLPMVQDQDVGIIPGLYSKGFFINHVDMENKGW